MRSIENAPGHDRGHPQHAWALAAAILIGCVAMANRCGSAYAAATAFALGDGASVQTPNIFAPTFTPAFAIRDLSWFVLGICAVIFAVVAGLLTYSVICFRRRPGEDEREPQQVYGSNQIELAWTVVPILISVPRVPRRGHCPQAGGCAGEPAVKRRHTPSYGVRFSDARPASGRNPDGVGCVLLSGEDLFNYGSPAIE